MFWIARSTLVNHWNLSDYRTSRIRYGLRADGIINIIRNRLLFKMKSPGWAPGRCDDECCVSKYAILIERQFVHVIPKRKNNAMTCDYPLPVISVGRFDLLYGLTEITENYACGRLSRSILLKKKRNIAVMRVAFIERINQFQASVYAPVFCRLIFRFHDITALDHEDGRHRSSSSEIA